MRDHRHPSRRAMLTGIALLGVLGVVLLAVGGAVWHAQGGRWFVTTSPSMGTELPVGTFLLTRAGSVEQAQVGDVVTFRSPGSGAVFTHRVVGRDATGLQTKGDVNGVPDAWTITDRELVGEVAWHAPVLGWVVRALPLLVGGLALVRFATRWLSAGRRRSVRLVGSSAVVALVGWWLSPWVGMARLGQAEPPRGGSGVLMDVISTGLLPVEAREVDGPAAVHLVDGEVGRLHLTAGAETGAFDVTAALDLPWWGWGILALVCLGPLWVSLAVGAPAVEPVPRHRGSAAEPAIAETADPLLVGGPA